LHNEFIFKIIVAYKAAKSSLPISEIFSRVGRWAQRVSAR